MKKKIFSLSFFLVLLFAARTGAESRLRINTELFASAYRGRNDWYFTGTGKADIRFTSTGNTSIRAEAAVEFYPIDLSGGLRTTSVPIATLKSLWVKASFPKWRLTLGKTKVAWGNGFVFNSGDILFGSLSPYVNFRTEVREDTAFLAAFNVPTGRFSFVEGVLLPPSLSLDSQGNLDRSTLTINHSSGGIRYFFSLSGWKFEIGYLYKGEEKTAGDFLGHRPYFSFHGHAGIDFYGAVSFAVSQEGSPGQVAATDRTVLRSLNLTLGAFHQISVGYGSTMSFRLETLIMPGRSWNAQSFQSIINDPAYAMFIYPQILWAFQSGWTVGLQSIISPIDASAQITLSGSWNVFQGFTLLGYLVTNAGNENSLFAWDRSQNWPTVPGTNREWANEEFNGISITLGAQYTY